MIRSLTIGLLAGVALLLVADAIGVRAGLVTGLLPHSDGPWLWTASRAAGVTAFVALTADVLFGLFISTGAADGWIPRARTVDIHRWLSSVALGLTGAHALLLAGSGFDLLDAFIPFIAPYRPVAVGLGVLAGLTALVVHASFGLRGRIGARAWRRLHLLSFAAFTLALVHGLLAGSAGGQPWMRAIYLVTGGLVLALLALRLLRRR